MNEVTLYGLRFEVAGFSEQGPRSENQDAFSVEAFADSGILAVADGMGGERSGRIAAETALQAVLGSGPVLSTDAARRAARIADETVIRKSEADPETFGGMGCALGFLALAERGGDVGWLAAHVGDVRIFSRSPDGVLRLETRDHTPAFARWEAGEISLDEIPDSSGANRLQRAIGRGGEADVVWLPAAPGWSWLIVSDGVSKAMRLEEIAAALDAPSADAACEAIRRKVEQRGADDNYTAVVVRALAEAAAGAPRSSFSPDVNSRSMSVPPGTRQASSRLGGVAAVLAAAALLVSVLALVRAGSSNAALEERIEGIGTRVDSLNALVGELLDPFGPADPPAATPGDALAPPVQP